MKHVCWTIVWKIFSFWGAEEEMNIKLPLRASTMDVNRCGYNTQLVLKTMWAVQFVSTYVLTRSSVWSTFIKFWVLLFNLSRPWVELDEKLTNMGWASWLWVEVDPCSTQLGSIVRSSMTILGWTRPTFGWVWPILDPSSPIWVELDPRSIPWARPMSGQWDRQIMSLNVKMNVGE